MADEDDLRRLQAGETDFAQSDLREADLSGRDLSGCDFTGAHFEKAVAQGANFSRSTLTNILPTYLNASGSDFSATKSDSTVFVQVNFEKCNFTNSTHNGSLFSKVNFNGSNFSGADFANSHFNEGTSLEGAYADEATRFDGATVFRPLAREPVFRFYRIERGKMVRRTEVPDQPDQQEPTEFKSAHESTSIVSSESVDLVQKRIAQQPTEIAVMAVALSAAIEDQIAQLATEKPNEPRALEAYEDYVSFLQNLALGLKNIHAAIADALQSPQEVAQKDKLSRVAGIASILGYEVEEWIKHNSKSVVDYGFKTTLLGAGTAFLSFCGVPAWEAFVPLASYLSGGTFMDGVKELKKPTGSKIKAPSSE